MKTLILVVGRSGAGKDTLVRYAQKQMNFPSVPSYTDRPIRQTERNGREHTFLTAEGFDNVMQTEHVFAYTKIGVTGFRYCATTEMIDRNDSDVILYIIDPNGVKYVEDNFADKYKIVVVYVYADKKLRKERADKRNHDDSAWVKRNLDEDAQFTEFERNVNFDKWVENVNLEKAKKEFVAMIERITKGNHNA